MEPIFGIHHGLEMLLKLSDIIHDSFNCLLVLSDLFYDFGIVILHELSFNVLFKCRLLVLIQISVLELCFIEFLNQTINDFPDFLFVFIFFQIGSMLGFKGLELTMNLVPEVMKGFKFNCSLANIDRNKTITHFLSDIDNCISSINSAGVLRWQSCGQLV